MERVRLIAGSHRWLLLAALALLALALGSAMFSGANFSSSSANSAALSTGSIQLTSSLLPDQEIVASTTGLKPGQSREGTIVIGNKAGVPGKVTLTPTGLTGTVLAAVIDLKIEDVTSGAIQKWSGKLGAFPGLSLGSFAAEESRKYRFTLSWPAASNEASLQGTSTSVTFEWNGVWSGS
jgi:ethanolamine utilization microcompartment shell protein EutS